MPNPAGNYPGRQIFLGSVEENPAFVYLVTGRSPPSQGRVASPYLLDQNAIRMVPVDPKAPFDQCRHYQAVRIEPETGLLIVSNSQAPVEGIYEAFWLGPKVGRKTDFAVEDILRALGPEYDSKDKPTSRIVGVVSPHQEGTRQELGITNNLGRTESRAQSCVVYNPDSGQFRFLPTYNGDINYENFGYVNGVFTFNFDDINVELHGRTPEELAEEVYGMTDFIDPTYGDLRVCTIAGVKTGRGPGGWNIARRNRWQSPEQFSAYLAERSVKSN